MPNRASCCTNVRFLDNDETSQTEACERGHAHSCLGEVLDMAQAANVQHLALYHISKRYTDEEIVRTIRASCARRDLKAKVSIALPGRIHYGPLRPDHLAAQKQLTFQEFCHVRLQFRQRGRVDIHHVTRFILCGDNFFAGFQV